MTPERVKKKTADTGGNVIASVPPKASLKSLAESENIKRNECSRSRRHLSLVSAMWSKQLKPCLCTLQSWNAGTRGVCGFVDRVATLCNLCTRLDFINQVYIDTDLHLVTTSTNRTMSLCMSSHSSSPSSEVGMKCRRVQNKNSTCPYTKKRPSLMRQSVNTQPEPRCHEVSHRQIACIIETKGY